MIKEKEKINIQKLNEIILSSSNILKIAHILLLIIGIYAITLIFEKWSIIAFGLSILKIISPFFIGFIIAWLLNPMVIFLQKKDINRVLGTIIVYLILLILIYLFISTLIPLFSAQINDFVSILPNTIDTLKAWVDRIFSGLNIGDDKGVSSIKTEIFNIIEQFEIDVTTNLPSSVIYFLKNFIYGVGNFAVGLLIGFFMLFDFHNVNLFIVKLVPRSMQCDYKKIIKSINTASKHFVHGVLMLSFIVFIISTLGFYIVGLKAPLLFGLICGITNIIPILGPYIGGFIAITVGLTQSFAIGALVLIVVFIIQLVEGQFVMPLVMSKTMKLHPVTIILSLLIFGHLFGIIGMIISTPIVAIIKIFVIFLNDKYKLFNFD